MVLLLLSRRASWSVAKRLHQLRHRCVRLLHIRISLNQTSTSPSGSVSELASHNLTNDNILPCLQKRGPVLETLFAAHLILGSTSFYSFSTLVKRSFLPLGLEFPLFAHLIIRLIPLFVSAPSHGWYPICILANEHWVTFLLSVS